MTLNTRTIISATERMLTLAKMAQVSDDRDTRRAELLTAFERLATDLGKIAVSPLEPDWDRTLEAIWDLHTEACNTAERSIGEWSHAGSVERLSRTLTSTAAILGFTLSDAATADIPEDEIARRYAEGHRQEAAE